MMIIYTILQHNKACSILDIRHQSVYALEELKGGGVQGAACCHVRVVNGAREHRKKGSACAGKRDNNMMQ